MKKQNHMIKSNHLKKNSVDYIKKSLLIKVLLISRAICEHDTNDFNKMVLVS